MPPSCRASGKRQQWRRADSSTSLETCQNPGVTPPSGRVCSAMWDEGQETRGGSSICSALLFSHGPDDELCTTDSQSRPATNAIAKRLARPANGHCGRRRLAVACGCLGALVRNQASGCANMAPRLQQMQPKEQPSSSTYSSG
jgi:hypothetical protein